MSASRWLASGNFFTSYRSEQRIFTTHLDYLCMAVFLVSLYIWPFFFPATNKVMLVINDTMIAMIAVLGLNIVTGFAGLISIGQAALVGIGAYNIATFVRVLGSGNAEFVTHWWPLLIVMSGFIGAFFAAIVGLPAMRLKHLYLVITTLGFQIIFEWLIGNLHFFDSGQTISVGRVYWFGEKVVRKEHYMFWYFVILTIVILCGFMIRNLMRTRYGRCLIAVRDNDRASDAMGMHPGLTKVYAFALSGFFGGIAGGLKAYFDRGVGIESFSLHHSIEYLAMGIVGGFGTLNGAFWGTGAVQFLDMGVSNFANWISGLYPDLNWTTALRPLSFGLVIVFFLMYEPRGIANWWRIFKSYLKKWPFKY